MARPTIGLLIDWLDNDYASSVAFAFHDEVRSRGMRFLCFVGHHLSAPGTPADGSNVAYRLANARVLDGLAVVSLGNQSSLEQRIEFLGRFRPLPLCTLTMACPGVPFISVDNKGGMHDAVAHLIDEHGRRRIAFIGGSASSEDADQRFQGYASALAERGIPLDESLVVSGAFTRNSARAATRVLLDERRVSFNALVAANDSMAAAALLELSARGVRVPETVAICGFDDVEDSRFADPPISSVRQSWRMRARLGVEALLEQRAGRTAKNQLVAAEFVARRSCGCDVQFAATTLTHNAGLELRVANWDWRKASAALIVRTLAQRGVRLAEDPARALVECYWEEISGVREGGFLIVLEQELSERLLERASLSSWYHALARLRADVLARLEEDPAQQLRAEALMHRALERVSYAAERQQALRRLEFERQGRLLALAGQATSNAFDLEGIEKSLTAQLPALGVPSFHVCKFIGRVADTEPPAHSRLLISHDTHRSDAVLGQPDFETATLLPAGVGSAELPLGFVVEALHFQNKPLGYALMEIGPRQGAIYLALREQLSAALEGASLVAQVAQRAVQREQAERERMRDELRIARRVQVSILPTEWKIPGLDVAASLLPGQLPGADYFDVRPDPAGAWLCVGSARGGGLGPSLLVPMLQSIVASLCQSLGLVEPDQLLARALEVLQDHIEKRMRERQHVSLLVARYTSDGRVRFAADYAGVALCPWHGSPTRPAFVLSGVSPRGEALMTGELRLAPHDLLLLHTQGLTRSSDFEDAPIGDEHIGRELEKNRAGPVEKIRDGLLGMVERWSGKRADLSVIVGRRLGPC
jgi:sigma-B regulation protein RsbU (phosphoserine phosphatase)